MSKDFSGQEFMSFRAVYYYFMALFSKIPVKIKTFLQLQVIDALELAFKELDSEESVNVTMEENEQPKDTAPKSLTVDDVDKMLDFDIEKKVSVTPLYENIDIFNQNSMVDTEAFPLDMPTNALEPPKEKPPPPPMEDSAEDELLGNVSITVKVGYFCIKQMWGLKEI